MRNLFRDNMQVVYLLNLPYGEVFFVEEKELEEKDQNLELENIWSYPTISSY